MRTLRRPRAERRNWDFLWTEPTIINEHRMGEREDPTGDPGPRPGGEEPLWHVPHRPPRVVARSWDGLYETVVYVQHGVSPKLLHIRRYWHHPTMGRVPTPAGVSIAVDGPQVIDDLIRALEELRPRR